MKRESGEYIKSGAVPATVNSIVFVTTFGHFSLRLHEREGRSEGVSQETCQHVIISYTRAKCDLNLKTFHFEISWGIWHFLLASWSYFKQPGLCTVGHCLASGSGSVGK